LGGRHVLGEHYQGHDIDPIPTKNAVVVDIEALVQGLLRIALHFDVNQQPGFRAIAQEHLDELVGIAAAQRGIADDAFKFRVEKLVALVPVDIGVDPGEEERQKGVKILLNRLFPGAVIVGADRCPGLCSRLGLGGLGFGGG
jgi:hypothetical protein